MSNSGEPKRCNNSCGQLIYFDKNSHTGHPSPDKWIPLEIKEGRKTDVAHNCPKKKNGQTLTTTTETKTKPTIAPIGSLEFAQQLKELLEEYIRLKTKEQGEATAAK